MTSKQRCFFLFVLALAMGGTPAIAQAPTAAQIHQAPVAGATAEGVMLVIVLDVSGSMAKVIELLAEAEIEQLTRSLLPGDLYVRIPFNATARVAILQQVHVKSDIDMIASVVRQNSVAAGRTSLSSGLIAAKEAAEKYRADRRVVLVMPTDAISAARDVDGERRRMQAVTAWWRDAPRTERIVVGVDRGANTERLRALAKDLDARLVTPGAFAKESVVERALVQARPPKAPSAPVAVPVEQHDRSWIWWSAPFALLGLALVLVRRHRRNRMARGRKTRGGAIVLPTASPTKRELLVKVTSGGRTNEHVIDVDSLDDGIVTLGSAGLVPVSTVAGSPIAIEVIGDELVVNADAVQGLRVEGELFEAPAQALHVGRTCRLSVRGVSVTAQLRRAGEIGGTRPRQVVGLRRHA